MKKLFVAICLTLITFLYCNIPARCDSNSCPYPFDALKHKSIVFSVQKAIGAIHPKKMYYTVNGLPIELKGYFCVWLQLQNEGNESVIYRDSFGLNAHGNIILKDSDHNAYRQIFMNPKEETNIVLKPAETLVLPLFFEPPTAQAQSLTLSIPEFNIFGLKSFSSDKDPQNISISIAEDKIHSLENSQQYLFLNLQDPVVENNFTLAITDSLCLGTFKTKDHPASFKSLVIEYMIKNLDQTKKKVILEDLKFALKDEHGNHYEVLKQTPLRGTTLYPEKNIYASVRFQAPVDTAEMLTLSINANGLSYSKPVLLKILTRRIYHNDNCRF